MSPPEHSFLSIGGDTSPPTPPPSDRHPDFHILKLHPLIINKLPGMTLIGRNLWGHLENLKAERPV